MTAITYRAESAIVRIILGVAGRTVLQQLQPPAAYRPAVAGQAVQPGMCAPQRKACLPGVVETPDPPTVRRMTQFTKCPQPAFVHVLTAMAGDTFGTRIGILLAGVTFFAVDDLVQADQWKPGQTVIESDTFTPTFRAVALVAPLALSAPMFVVDLVTGITLRARSETVRILFMAVRTIDPGVPAAQRKFRIPVMGKTEPCPFPGTVALAAAFTEVPLVFVVRPVAGDARRIQLVFTRILSVAVFAAQLPVAPGQRKIRLPRMVEPQHLPGLRRMTGLAILPEPALVNIVNRVTGTAAAWCLLVARVGMAADTTDFQVPAEQAEPGPGMVEAGRFPAFFAVTGLALSAQPRLVRIVLTMTCITVRRRRTVFLSRLMAQTAVQSAMPAAQYEISLSVIEIVLVKLDDITLAADMLRMTGTALIGADLPGFTVKTPVMPDVRGDLVVTVQAQHGLRALVKTQMAACTFLFITRMPFNQLAGHDESLR